MRKEENVATFTISKKTDNEISAKTVSDNNKPSSSAFNISKKADAAPVYAPTLEEERANERDKMLTPSASRTPTLVERLGKIVTGAAKSTGASYVNNAGTAIRGEAERQKQQNAGEIAAWQDTIKAYRDVLADPASTQSERETAKTVIADLNRRIDAYGKAYGTGGANERAANTVWEAADRLADSANADIERAQEGLGTVGKLLTGVGVAGTQMAIDMLTAPPGATLVPLFFRASGQAAQGARREGADFDTANTVGGLTGAVEVLTEKMFDGLAGIYGGGAADDLVAQFISKHTSSPAFGRLLSYAASAAGESVEEVVSGLVDPAIQSIYNKKSYGENFDPQELLESAIIGGLLGLVGGNTMYNNVLEADVAAIEAENEAAGVGEGATERALEMLTGRTTVRSAPAAAQDAQESAQRVSRETMTPARETPQSGAQAQTFARYYEQDVRDMTGELGGKAFVERYDGTQDIAEYTAGFVRYWNAGAAGRKIGSVQNTGGLNELQRYAAYYAGQNDAARSTVSEQSGVKDVAINARRGLSSDGATARNTAAWSDELRGTVDALGRKLGVRVVVDDTFEGVSANGYYDAKTNEIHLAKDSENPVLQVVRHEATHRMQQLSPKEYRAFRDYAVRMAGEDAVEEKRQAYSRGRVELSEEEAMDEIAAETAEKLLTDETAISDFIRENRTAAQKFYDALRSIVQKVKEALGADQTLAQAERLWKSAFEKADAQAQENAANKNAAQTDGVKYSLVTDKKTLDFLDAQKTVKVYRAMQLIDGKLYPPMAARVRDESGKKAIVESTEANRWYQSDERPDLIKNGKFELDKANGSSIEAAYNPYFHTSLSPLNDQFSSAYNRGNLVTVEGEVPESELTSGYKAQYAKDAVGEVKWHSGPVSSKLAKAGNPRRVILSRYFKMNRIVPDAEVAEKIADMLSDTGISIPYSVVTPSLRSELERRGVPIERDGKKFSLKTDSEGRELSEQQQEYFKDSKSVDTDGRLKVMYQGGNGDFTVFDRKKSKGSNLYGRGFYFTDSEAQAKQYGGARAFYLNVTNPLTPGQNSITRRQMRDFLSAVAENEDYGLENYGYGATVDSVLESVYGKGDFEMLQDVNATAIGDLVAAAELFNEVNGTDYDGIILPTETVTFRSNQAKNVANAAPTDNADIRFSLKAPVEETDDLIAVHNLTEKNLTDALDLGGLPMPSIAVVKAKNGHSKYGPISLVFGKDTIDPRITSANRVYGGDAYTATAPSIGYKIDYDVMKSIRDKLHSVLDDETYNAMHFHIDTDNLTDALKRNGGDFKQAYGRDRGMRLAFLKDTGKELRIPKKDVKYEVDAPALREIIKKFDVDSLYEMGYQGFEQNEPEVRKALFDYTVTSKDQTVLDNGKTIAQVKAELTYGKKLPFSYYYNIIEDARKIKHNGVEKEVDTTRLDTRIAAYFKSKKMQAEYEAWLDDLSRGIVAKKGIRNNADPYTRIGDRRSFEALYDDYTLANIVKAMKAGQEERGNQFFGASATTLQSVTTPSYGSIAEIKADSGRLARYDDETYEAMKKEIDDELFAVINEIYDTTKHWSDNQFTEYDSIAEAMVNAARRGGTADAIVRSFKRDGYSINGDVAQRLKDLYRRSADLPTEYFEAKPRRAVEFDEVRAVVAPKNLDPALKQRLEDEGIKVISYKTGDDADRTKKLNSIKDVRFSLRDNSPEAVAAKQQEMIEYLRGQLRRSRGVTTKKGDVAKIARATAKAWDSSADVTERLQAMYDFMANGKDASGNELTWDDLWSEAKSIAGDMLGESMTRNDDLYREYADLRRTVRDTKLNVPKEMDGDLDVFGGYSAFRRGEGRALNLSRSEGTGIDDFFQTLSDSYPEYFDEALASNPADQLARIAEVMNDLKPVYENRFAGDEQAVNYLADELINSFYDARQEAPTFADKAALDKQEAVAKVKNAARDKMQTREAKLRSAYDERIAKMREMNRQKIDERMSKLREQRDKKLEAVKDKYKAKEAKGRERRNASELRGKIIRHSKELSAKLLKPNDKQHIPERLRVTVAAVLDAINEESTYSIDETTGKRVTDGSGTPTKRTEAFRALRAAFSEIRSNGEADGMTIDPDLEDNLTEIETMRDIPLGSMNVGQLTTIWNTLKAVETAVRNENKAFGAQRFKTISDFAEHIKLDNLTTRERGNSPNRVVNAVDNLLNVDQLTPEAYFRRLGSTGTDIFNMLRRAQDKHITIMQQAQEYTKNAVGKTDVYELEKEMHTFTVNGEDVTLSTAQLMSLYELMKRPQALEHLELGGIRATDTGRSGVKRGGRSTPVKPDLNMLLDMTNELTPEQKALADKLQSYMANELADLGNEASMEVYGYEKFTEENYFPIKVDKNQTKTDVAKEAQSATIAGRGFTKGTKPHANNAVMIDSIFSVFAEHTSDMATYSAWLGAMENLSRIWNFAFYDADNARVGDVKSIIERSFGKGGNGYMRQLIDNLNNGVRAKDGNSIMDMLTGSYKASAIGANLRVWLQQPTAILRALNEISPADFLAGAKRDKPGTWNKVREYAPIAVWKDWGYFDADTGRQMKDVLFGDSSRLNKLNNALIAPAGTMDSIAWSHLWNALEVETLRTHPELADGSEAFYKAVAQRFNGVIDRTQVVDGILQRSQIMRSSNGAVKMATSFMSEPTKVYNMFASDLHEARTAQNPQARKAAKAKLARTSAALLASFAANAAAQALVDGLRDDDRERDYWEKFLTAYTENGLDALNPASYIPIARDILSIYQGYGVERMDMSAFDALIKAAINAGKAIEGGGRKSVQNAVLELVNSGARVFGIPAANVKRDLFAVLNTAANETDNYGMQYALYKFLYNPEYPQNKTEVKKILWNAYQNDRAAYDAIYADAVKNNYFATETQTTEENLAAWLKKQEKAATFEGNSSAYYKAAENLRTQYGKLYTLANDKGRKDADDFLVSYYSGDGGATSKTNDKLGVSAEDYASYLLALSVYDEKNKSGNLGTYTNAERESAINATKLSKQAKAWLWDKETKNKNNPWK